MDENGKLKESMPETEVIATAQRRQYSREYKERILAEIDAGARARGSGGDLAAGRVVRAVDQQMARAAQGRLSRHRPARTASQPAGRGDRAAEAGERAAAGAAGASRDHHRGPKKSLAAAWAGRKRSDEAEVIAGGGRTAGADRGASRLPGAGAGAQPVLSQAAAAGQSPSRSPLRRGSCRKRSGRKCASLLNSPRFVDQAPREVYASLLDEGALCLFGAQHVPHPGRARRGARAARPTAPPDLHQAGTAGHRPQPGVELGYHQAVGTGQMELLLPVYRPGYLQPLCGGLDDRPARGRPSGRDS